LYLKKDAKDSEAIRVLSGFSKTLILGGVPVNQVELKHK